ncbi:MAG: DUF4386 family protein [Candidatus Cybelea sp.]
MYLLYFLTAMFSTTLHGPKLAVYRDALSVISIACYIAVTLFFYAMFKPVNKNLSLLAAVFSLGGCGVQALSNFHFIPSYVSPLVFFGPFCILIGYLIIRSTFLPRALGALMALAGVGWLVYLAPPVAGHLSIYIEVLGILAEGLLMLWLLLMGVNVERWKEQAR